MNHIPAYIDDIENDQQALVITDHLGSVRLVVNSDDGAMLQHMDYDAFGLVLSNLSKGRKGALLTFVERKSLYTVIRRLTGKRADLLAESAIDAMADMKEKVKTITLDNGLEFSAHESIAEGLDANIYFAHPYASWERGINENTNGLIRQYFPKDTNFNEVADEDIQFVMDRLNSRPRATRNFKSPNEIFLGQRVDLLVA